MSASNTLVHYSASRNEENVGVFEKQRSNLLKLRRHTDGRPGTDQISVRTREKAANQLAESKNTANQTPHKACLWSGRRALGSLDVPSNCKIQRCWTPTKSLLIKCTLVESQLSSNDRYSVTWHVSWVIWTREFCVKLWGTLTGSVERSCLTEEFIGISIYRFGKQLPNSRQRSTFN